ncbi:MAG TPA: hypothetical protein VKU00_28075 [Chthonomonadaceae bacterium]|nr:hypothetical protein [Chthonomonadaceae bacterium]
MNWISFCFGLFAGMVVSLLGMLIYLGSQPVDTLRNRYMPDSFETDNDRQEEGSLDTAAYWHNKRIDQIAINKSTRL